MTIDIALELLLHNVQVAVRNYQYSYATFLLDYAIKCAEYGSCPSSHFPLDVAIGLHRGQVRAENEDCVFALQGIFPETQDAFGLFVVADGMGGHACGQEAASLAIQAIVNTIFPSLVNHAPLSWEALLLQGIQHANRVIYCQNQMRELETGIRGSCSGVQGIASTAPLARMGTTVTAALLIGETAYIANVGDSRTYLSSHTLSRITQDHSVVEHLLACGAFKDEEERYSHHTRNQITRVVGMEESVEVDSFVCSLDADAILLLCSDGVWEMTRDRAMAPILASPSANAASMTNQLVQLANAGGGTDNIGCIVVRRHTPPDVSEMHTTILDPVDALTRLVTTSSL